MCLRCPGALPFGVNRSVSWSGDVTRVFIPTLTPFFSDIKFSMAADVEATAGIDFDLFSCRCCVRPLTA